MDDIIDPRVRRLREDLKNLSAHLAKKEKERLERIEFVKRVFGPAFEKLKKNSDQ